MKSLIFFLSFFVCNQATPRSCTPELPKMPNPHNICTPQSTKPANTYYIVSFIREMWDALLSVPKEDTNAGLFDFMSR